MNALARSRRPEADEPEAAPPVARRGWFRRLAAEPLVHFVVAGLLLFIAGRIYETRADVYRIVVTPRHVAQLAHDYALQFGAPPDAATLEALVKADLKDEILYRQGEAMKLGEGDEIVRRRVVQKMQFLMQDTNAPADPTPAQLQAFYDTHADRYLSPARTTFSHIYFAAEGGDQLARARAQALLSAMPNSVTRAPDRGDPFPDLYDFSAAEPEQVQRLFGHTPFAEAVFKAPVGRWSGPYKSGYGWHLLYVDAREAPARAPLSAVKDAVRVDYLQDAQDRANRTAFDKLARRFTIVRADRKASR
jgi:hypothetical protein